MICIFYNIYEFGCGVYGTDLADCIASVPMTTNGQAWTNGRTQTHWHLHARSPALNQLLLATCPNDFTRPSLLLPQYTDAALLGYVDDGRQVLLGLERIYGDTGFIMEYDLTMDAIPTHYEMVPGFWQSI